MKLLHPATWWNGVAFYHLDETGVPPTCPFDEMRYPHPLDEMGTLPTPFGYIQWGRTSWDLHCRNFFHYLRVVTKPLYDKPTMIHKYYYRPRTKYEGRYCFHRCLSVHISGGVPHPADRGGVPHPADGGTPSKVQAEGGTPSSWQGCTPSQVQVGGGTPSSRWGYPIQGSRGWGYPIQLTGMYPIPGPGGGRYPIQLTGGTPSEVQVGGRYPTQPMGVPHPAKGVPHPRSQQGGTPSSLWGRGTPSQVQGWYPGPGGGYPALSRTRWGNPLPNPRLDGVLPPVQDWMWFPPNPPIRRQSSIASTCYMAGSMPLAFTQEDFLVLDCSTRNKMLCLKHH